MSYQILPNIVFIFSVLGILLIILRRLPEAAQLQREIEAKPNAENALAQKGLPIVAFSKVTITLKFWIKKAWNFILEAKDLKPHAAAGYKMKKIFGNKMPVFKKPALAAPQTFHEVRNEQYFLDVIKLQPKNLNNYDALGKFYLEQQNFVDAKNIYLYLTTRQKANPDYHARLAYTFYQDKEYQKAAESYQRSLALDSTQPNRYYNLGLSQEASGKPEEAIKSFSHAITLEPAVKFYVSLSNLYFRQGNSPKAKETLLEAKKLDPENQTILAKLERVA